MVRIEILCISSFQPNRSSYSKSQEGEVFGDHDYTMVENTVLVSHDGIITEKFPDTSSIKHTDWLYHPKDQQNTHVIRKWNY